MLKQGIFRLKRLYNLRRRIKTLGFSNEDLFGADCSDVVNPSGVKEKMESVCVKKKNPFFLEMFLLCLRSKTFKKKKIYL